MYEIIPNIMDRENSLIHWDLFAFFAFSSQVCGFIFSRYCGFLPSIFPIIIPSSAPGISVLARFIHNNY